MAKQSNPAEAFIRKRFETFKKLSAEMGEKKAMETMFAGYTDQLKRRMEPYLGRPTLAEGLRAAVAEFNKSGWDMDVVDISNKGMDAALEIQNVCPVNDIHQEFGYESPCFLICAPDGPAIKEAFPELKVTTLCRQADGDCICMFKFERLKG
jgi:predicted ArsR family transcriptional regulator